MALNLIPRRPLLSLRSFVASGRRMAAAEARSSSSKKKKRVDFFYDVLSPYSWLGFEESKEQEAEFIHRALKAALAICRYRDIWNIELHLRPVLLAGIMKETGNRPPAMLPKRGEYMTKDLMRMAKFFQVPLQFPKDFMGSVIVKGSLSAMRFITAVDLTQPQFVESVSRELWMRVWSRDEDITQPANILAAAGKAGLPSDQAQKLLEMSSTPEVKNHLKATTDEVLGYGAFGMPCSVTYVDDQPQLLFGSDRLELLASLLGEKWLGPVPGSSKL